MSRWDQAAPPGTERLDTQAPPAMRIRQSGVLGSAFGSARLRTGRPPVRVTRSAGNPGVRVMTVLIALDVVIAAVQAGILRSERPCRSAACTVVTLGGYPTVCLAVAAAAAATLVWCLVVPPTSASAQVHAAAGWAAVAGSIVASAGALAVVVAALVITLVVVAVLKVLVGGR